MPDTNPTLLLVAAEATFLASEVAVLAGHFTIERAAPSAALQQFCALSPGGVVIDATLPGLIGASLPAETQDSPEEAGTPLYLLTEDSQSAEWVAQMVGEERCLLVPCLPGSLTRVLRELLGDIERTAT